MLEGISGANLETSRQGSFQVRPSKKDEITFNSRVSKHLEEHAVTNFKHFFLYTLKNTLSYNPANYKLANE